MLILSFIMWKDSQIYSKNLAVFTLKDFVKYVLPFSKAMNERLKRNI